LGENKFNTLLLKYSSIVILYHVYFIQSSMSLLRHADYGAECMTQFSSLAFNLI